MGESDLTLGEGLGAFWHSLEVPADRDQGCRGVAGQVAVESDGVNRARIARVVVMIRNRVLPCQMRRPEVQQIPLMEHLLELFKHLLWLQVLRREHKEMLQTNVRFVNSPAR